MALLFLHLLQTLLVSLDHFLDHLAADGAGLTGGQVTVVAVLQVDAHFGSSLHLELVHSLTGLGNIDLIIALHSDSLLFDSSESKTPSEEVVSFLSVGVFLPEVMEKLMFLFGKIHRFWKRRLHYIHIEVQFGHKKKNDEIDLTFANHERLIGVWLIMSNPTDLAFPTR